MDKRMIAGTQIKKEISNISDMDTNDTMLYVGKAVGFKAGELIKIPGCFNYFKVLQVKNTDFHDDCCILTVEKLSWLQALFQKPLLRWFWKLVVIAGLYLGPIFYFSFYVYPAMLSQYLQIGTNHKFWDFE